LRKKEQENKVEDKETVVQRRREIMEEDKKDGKDINNK
jgi:hypothetical protein